MLLHIFVVLLHDCQLETGRCTVHADIDRVGFAKLDTLNKSLFNGDFFANNYPHLRYPNVRFAKYAQLPGVTESEGGTSPTSPDR